MDFPQEIDDYVKESIDEALGQSVSAPTLQLKLRASEDARHRLRDQYLLLLEKSRQKERLVDRVKAETNMNAAAVKKFVEENQRLAAECSNLVSECSKWEKECWLYDNDREALMDFGNEAGERAKVANIKVHQLEDDLWNLTEELQFYKHEYDKRGADSSNESADMEKNSLDSLLASLVREEELESGHAFLEANSRSESCQKLLKMQNSLRPSTQKVLTLAAKVKALQKDKELLRINLARAEAEVKLLSDENNILDEENKKLIRQYHRERNLDSSCGKQTSSASAKRNKRKSSPKMDSPTEMKIDYKDADSARQPLSPLRNNSPDSRMHKK